MEFTYKGYADLISLLKQQNYQFTNYRNYKDVAQSVIIRHDVDNSLEMALKIAELENQLGIRATFFILLSTNFYNILSKSSSEILKKILNLNHEIGLHFDEKRYKIDSKEELEHNIEYEKRIVEDILKTAIDVVSMHRPSKWVLEGDIHFKNIINSYSKEFFQECKYLSDSRMHWREDVVRIVENREFKRLQILTHPFWYSAETGDIRERVGEFIKKANIERYCHMKENISDIESIIKEGEFICR